MARRMTMWCATSRVLLACVLIASKASAQGPQPQPERVMVSKTASANCFDSNRGKVFGSVLVRTPILLSPDGDYQAYAESEAVPEGRFKNGDDESRAQCANTSKLFLKGPGEEAFRQVFVQEPSLYELFSDIKVKDWSPNDRYLLAELSIGQYGSDFGGFSPLLIDAQDGVSINEKLVVTAFRRYFGRDCDFGVKTLGFAPDGAVALQLFPEFDVEGSTDPASCVQGEGFWRFSAGAEAVRRLPDSYKVQRYGRFLEDPSEK